MSSSEQQHHHQIHNALNRNDININNNQIEYNEYNLNKNERNSPQTYSYGSIEEGNFILEDDFNLGEIGGHQQNNPHNDDEYQSNFRMENDSTILKDEDDHEQSQQQQQNNISLMIDSIPAIRELMLLVEADPNGKIYFDHFFKLLKKLKICQNHFFLFFSRELKSINLSELSVPELQLRLALELFRVLGREKLQLELRDIMNYNKAHIDLDIDFIQLLEMFEFYDNIYSGVIKRKQNIMQFFQSCLPKLTNAIKDNFIYELQDLLSNCRTKLDQSTVSSSILKLKVYEDKEKELKNIHKKVLKNVSNKLEKESIQGLLKKNFNLNFEVTVEDNAIPIDKEDHVESEIEDFFQENRPKNKGWLFRKSKKHQNKWSNLFFYIYHDNSHLVSVKPTSLKREMDCENIELYKCSFMELVDYSEAKKACLERRKLRNKNFHSVTEGEKQNPYTNSNEIIKTSANQLMTTQQMNSKRNELSNFFIYDKVSQKSYLVRSEESLIIMSILSFYNKAIALQDKNDKETKAKLAEFAQMYSEYSGIIEIAICNKKQINQSYTDLSSFSFKKQYLIIKQGKCRIYNIKQKDKLNLMDYELKIDSRLPFVPSNPFSFMLEKVVKPNEKQLQQQQAGAAAEDEAKKKEEQISSQQSSVVMFNPQTPIEITGRRAPLVLNQNDFKNKTDFQNQLNNNLNNQKNNQQINTQQITTTQQPNQPQKQGFFSKIFQKIYKKTPDRLVIAADSEYKRKQWIFTINFHKTMLVRMKQKNKSSYNNLYSFNTNHFYSNLNTLENEFGQSVLQQNHLTNPSQNLNLHQQQLLQIKKQRQNNRGSSGFGSGEHKQNGQIIQGKNSIKLNDIEGDNDYYDIFAQKDVVEEVKEEDEEHNEDSPKIKPYKYNPNDYKDKLPNNQNNQIQTQPQTKSNGHHSRQGSSQQVLHTYNAQQSNLGTNSYKQSITRTTEEGLYTMSFPQNNQFFKKSLVQYDNQSIIMNSKEIRTFTDSEIWQKFLKHFLVFNHQYNEIDLQQFGINNIDKNNNINTQLTGNNFSGQKSTNYTQQHSKSTPNNKFINHKQFQFNPQEQNQDEQMHSIELTHQELQSSHSIQKKSTLFQELDIQENIEPQAQNVISRQIKVHKQY